MTNVPQKYTTAFHEPGRKCPCVCGSGVKFKRCCAGQYSSDAFTLFQDAFNAGDAKKALLYARQYFTWYVLSYKAHTIPYLKSKTEAAEKWLYTDIEALSESLENLFRCYHQLNRSSEFLDVLERVRNSIDDERWDAKITYIHSLWFLVFKGDESKAFTQLKGIDIESCIDADILALYMQICPTRLSFSQCIKIIDRILKSTTKTTMRLQYQVLKAVHYHLICEAEDGNDVFEKIIVEYKNLNEDKKTQSVKYAMAQALKIYGSLSKQDHILNQGKDIVMQLICEANEQGSLGSYLAGLFFMLGDCEEDLKNHSSAVEAYSKSLDESSVELTKVFLARSICNGGDCTYGKELLQSIDELSLDKAGKYDLAISWTILASKTNLAANIAEAKTRLERIETVEPLFARLRDHCIISLLEAKAKSKPGKWFSMLLFLNKYISLNPNLCGFGLNINKMIEDVDSDKED